MRHRKPQNGNRKPLPIGITLNVNGLNALVGRQTYVLFNPFNNLGKWVKKKDPSRHVHSSLTLDLRTQMLKGEEGTKILCKR